MTNLKVDVQVEGLPNSVGPLAETAEEMGFDGVWTNEAAHDSFLPHPIMADHTSEIELGTRIALAFTRSPMVLAYIAWDMAAFSEGRFILGLGTQVKGHNERRFSVEWSAPGPRLREVVKSLRHIWRAFRGEEPLDFQGEAYSFSLLTDSFNPGPIEYDIPIYIAGVNEYNLRLAGELCDGLCAHPFNTPSYTEEVIMPLVKEGAAKNDRSINDVELFLNPITITGTSDEEMQRSRKEARRQIAFYASTRTYFDVLKHHGWEDVGERLHELSKQQAWDEMTELITDEMMGAFAVEAPPSELGSVMDERYGHIADRITPSTDFDGEDYWEDIIDGF